MPMISRDFEIYARSNLEEESEPLEGSEAMSTRVVDLNLRSNSIGERVEWAMVFALFDVYMMLKDLSHEME